MVRLDTRPGHRRRVPQRLFSRHSKEVVAHALGVLVDPVHLQRGALGPRATVATNLDLAVASAKLDRLSLGAHHRDDALAVAALRVRDDADALREATVDDPELQARTASGVTTLVTTSVGVTTLVTCATRRTTVVFFKKYSWLSADFQVEDIYRHLPI